MISHDPYIAAVKNAFANQFMDKSLLVRFHADTNLWTYHAEGGFEHVEGAECDFCLGFEAGWKSAKEDI